MKWGEVRKQFLNRCVLVESLKARTEDNQRIIEAMSVIDDFENVFCMKNKVEYCAVIS